MIDLVKKRLAQLHELAPESAGDLLRLTPVEYDDQRREVLFTGKTEVWMRNPQGILHGGISATIADQAMGTLAFCVKPGDGIVPAIELHVNYHRPLIPGEGVLVRVRLIAQTKTLIHTSAELYRESAPEKLCVTASGTYFYKPTEGK